MKKKIFLGITCGDINGIGLETVIKVFQNSKLFNFCIPILYVPLQVFNFYVQQFQDVNFSFKLINNSLEAAPNQLNIISFLNTSLTLNPGLSTKIASQIAVRSINLVINDFKKQHIDFIVTLPVNKKNISITLNNFVGHTEYFAESFNNTPNIMLLCNDQFKIATLTNHVPISAVSSMVTKNLLKEKIQILKKVCQRDFLIKIPKIAVLSLNPHSGDEGLIGKEDNEIISPVIDEFNISRKFVFGPFSADAFFGTKNYTKYDIVLAMYHDQALIPFKTLSFGTGVNYTAGLPVVRVSPDHGVAYDIAAKGLADESSLLSTINFGIRVFQNRISR
ncbi:MAG: 4-hydroxythreonine-4-phosphate dehydrogenase PdxA [Flavobacteriales bacterium]|nr:4-hydroxythreonine-4-phosphate dehydrogenase PdxA [Flavobacteriales bacterium]|tara:strand:+ start:2939 stop:3940 length:1002 start_codon:yes stop_codon:yes gene_type:complete